MSIKCNVVGCEKEATPMTFVAFEHDFGDSAELASWRLCLCDTCWEMLLNEMPDFLESHGIYVRTIKEDGR